MTLLFLMLSPRLSVSVHSIALRLFAFAFSHRAWASEAVAVVGAMGVAAWAILYRKVSPEESERLRRIYLAKQGRITDAMLVDYAGTIDLSAEDPSGHIYSGEDDTARAESITDPNAAEPGPDWTPPSLLRYQYRIAGVTYECAQDVSLLADRVSNLRMDLPVQVRYDPHNPTNSIVAEIWSGLRQS